MHLGRVFLLAGLPALVFAISGCGGSGSGAQTSDSATQTIGNVSVGFSGKLTPLTSQGGSGALIIGASGASISTLTYNPTVNPTSTPMVYGLAQTTVNAPYQLWSYYLGAPRQLTSEYSNCFHPIYSSDGRIAFETGAAGISQIFTCNADGSGLKQITTDSATKSGVAWSLNNTKLIYGVAGSIYSANTDGSSPTKVATGVMPFSQPDSSDLYFVNTAGNYVNVFVQHATGTPVNLSHHNFSDTYPTVSPDGTRLAFAFSPASGSYTVRQMRLRDSTLYLDIPVTTPVDGLAYSADGKTLFVTTYSAQSSSEGISAYSVTGAPYGTIYVGNGPVGPYPVSCQPFPKARQFVGTGGVMSTTPAAGFLLVQNGDTFGGLLGFSATTPTTATITQVNSTGQELAYHLHADSITGVKYVNDYYSPVNSVAASVPDILVSINQSTGKIVFIAPYAAAPVRSAASVGGFAGPFKAVYDSSGHNVAPNGASSVDVLDGRVIAR